jgi:hypothetical protein
MLKPIAAPLLQLANQLVTCLFVQIADVTLTFRLMIADRIAIIVITVILSIQALLSRWKF